MARSPMERSTDYAEMFVEGKVSEAHNLIRLLCPLVGTQLHPEPCGGKAENHACDACEETITADMQTIVQWIALAWQSGYQTRAEERFTSGAGRRK